MRPIDADDVIERLDMICDAGGRLSPVTKAVKRFCKGLINHQPTIEAEPCTLCVYNPPSSCDGKPCTICPAHKRSTEPPKGE